MEIVKRECVVVLHVRLQTPLVSASLLSERSITYFVKPVQRVGNCDLSTSSIPCISTREVAHMAAIGQDVRNLSRPSTRISVLVHQSEVSLKIKEDTPQ